MARPLPAARAPLRRGNPFLDVAAPRTRSLREEHLPKLATLDGADAALSEHRNDGDGTKAMSAAERRFRRRVDAAILADRGEEVKALMLEHDTKHLRRLQRAHVARCAELIRPRWAMRTLWDRVRRINLRAPSARPRAPGRRGKVALRLQFWAFRIATDNAKLGAHVGPAGVGGWRGNTVDGGTGASESWRGNRTGAGGGFCGRPLSAQRRRGRSVSTCALRLREDCVVKAVKLLSAAILWGASTPTAGHCR